MGRISSVLRRMQDGFSHWCPGCEGMHRLPDSWTFDGNLDKPTFAPSFKHEGYQCIYVAGKWNGEWKRDANGNVIPFICHYILTAGILNFCTDSTHALAGQAIPLPTLPVGLTDEDSI